VHAKTNTTLTHLDLEGALITPWLIPGVYAEPVIETVFVTPTNGLDGVATKIRARLVGVDTRLVTEEVLVDKESSRDGTMSIDIGLNGISRSESI